MKTFVLPDTRPYPQSPIKNYLLLNAYQLAHNSSSASRKLSAGQLQTGLGTFQKGLSRQTSRKYLKIASHHPSCCSSGNVLRSKPIHNQASYLTSLLS